MVYGIAIFSVQISHHLIGNLYMYIVYVKPTNNLHYSEIRTQSVRSKFKGTKVNILIQCLRMCTEHGDYKKLLMARDYDWECAFFSIYGLWWNFVPQFAERK